MPEPFGIPGLAIEQLAIGVTYTFATEGPPPTGTVSTFGLLGRIQLGRAPEPANGADARAEFDVRLALENGNPLRMEIVLDRRLDVGAFISQCVTADSSGWPASFIDIAFEAGSRVYYYDAAADPTHAWQMDAASAYTFRDGFNVDARLTLTLVTEIDLRFTLQTIADTQPPPPPGGASSQSTGSRRYKGVTASVALDDPIDLLFVSLAGTSLAGHAYTGGPQLSITTGDSTTFSLTAGLNLFGRAIGSTQTEISRTAAGDTQVNGQVQSTDSLDPFGQLSFDYTYTRTHDGQNAFTIGSWRQFTWLLDSIDVIEQLRAAANAAPSEGCGTLAGLVAATALTTAYRVEPAAAADGDDLVFSLTVSCDLSIAGAADPFLTRTLPAISTRVPKSTQFANLPVALASSIAAAGPRFVRDLIDDPADFALFLAMTFGPQAVGIALDFVCRGLTDAAVPVAAEAAVAATGAEGATAATATGAAIAAIAAALAATQHGDGTGAGGEDGPITVGKPELRELSYSADMLTASWTAAAYAGSYELQFGPAAAPLSAVDAGLALTSSLALQTGAFAPGPYPVRVVARRGPAQMASDDRAILKLPAPAVALSYADGQLTATVSGEGDRYIVVFSGPDSAPTAGAQTVSARRPQASLAVPAPRTGTYAASAQALASGQISSDMSAPATLTLPAAPQNVVAHQEGSKLAIAWRPQGAPVFSYAVRVLQNDAILGTPLTGIRRAPATIAVPDVPAGSVLILQVQSISDRTISDWSSAPAVELLEIAVGLRMLYDAGASAVVAHWTAGAGDNHTYDIVLSDANGATVAGPVSTTTAEPTATIHDAPVREGRNYVGTVRMRVGDAFGPWGTPAALTIVSLPAPANLQAGVNGVTGQLTAQWAPAPQAFSGAAPTYDLQVHRAGGDGEPLLTRTGLTTARLDTPAPTCSPEEGAAEVRVRTVTSTAISAWATVSIPPLSKAVVDSVGCALETDPRASTLTVRWSEAETCAMRIAVDNAQPTIRDGLAGGTAVLTSAELGVAFASRSTIRVSVQAVRGLSRSAWSDETDRSQLDLRAWDAPTNLSLSIADGNLRVTWDGVAGSWLAVLLRDGVEMYRALVEDLEVGFPPSVVVPHTSLAIVVRRQDQRDMPVSRGVPATASLTVPSFEDWARLMREAQLTAPDAAAVFRSSKPDIDATTMRAALIAGGYPQPETDATIRSIYGEAPTWMAAVALPAAASSLTANGTEIYMYVIDSAGQVSQRCWDGTSWQDGAFRSTSAEGVQPGRSVAATAWLTADGTSEFRVYVVGTEGQIIEYGGNNRNAWYRQVASPPGVAIAAISWLTASETTYADPALHVRLYVAGTDGCVREHCWDGSDWRNGGDRSWENGVVFTSLSGASVAATAWLTSDQTINVRVYYPGPLGYVIQQCWNGHRWYQSPESLPGPGPLSIAATSWLMPASPQEAAQVRVYLVGSDGRVREQICNDEHKSSDGAVLTSTPAASVAAASYPTASGARIRVYTAGADGHISEHCWDNDTWHDGTY